MADVIGDLIRGAESACNNYLKISGYPPPVRAPESFVQAGAALPFGGGGQKLGSN
jgi:hypothetical protein